MKSLKTVTKTIVGDILGDKGAEHFGKLYTGDISNAGTALWVGDSEVGSSTKFGITQAMLSSNVTPEMAVVAAKAFVIS